MGGVIQQVVGIAASASIALVDGAPAARIKLLPVGTIEMRDGRGPFQIRDRAHAEQVIAATRKFLGGADLMIDYDHQVLAARPGGSGAKAIAAGWIKGASLTAEDDGIYAEPEWTEAAATHLAAREYRYLSPLFMAARDDGSVMHLKNVALVNIGAIDLPAIAAGITGEDETMTLALVAAALSLPAASTVETIVAAIDELKKPATSAIAIAAGLAETATAEEIAAAVTTIKADAGKPDPSKFVPIEQVTALNAKVATLDGERADREVAAAIESGKLAPAMKSWGLDYFKKDETGFRDFIKDAPVIVAAGAELDGTAPGTRDGIVIASAQGVTIETGGDLSLSAEGAVSIAGATVSIDCEGAVAVNSDDVTIGNGATKGAARIDDAINDGTDKISGGSSKVRIG